MKTIAKSAVKAIAVVFAVLAPFAGFLFANSRGAYADDAENVGRTYYYKELKNSSTA